MKLFLFNRIEHASNRYHEEGGLVIIAQNEEKAKQLLKNQPIGDEWSFGKRSKAVIISKEEWNKVEIFELNGNYESRIIAFPDAGCC